MLCPSCNGVGHGPALVDYHDGAAGVLAEVRCDRCDGSGEVPADAPDWMARGNRCRQARRINGRNLIRVAEATRMTTVEVSRMERGCTDPLPLERYWSRAAIADATRGART